jgi:hypothetical protein
MAVTDIENNSRQMTNQTGNNGSNGKRLLIPLKEAAEMLCMCRQTLMIHVKAGRLPCIRFAPNSVFFRPEDIECFIVKHLEKYQPTTIPNVRDLQ